MYPQCLQFLSSSFACLRYVAYKTAELSPEAMTGDISKEVWQEVAWTKARSMCGACVQLCSAFKFEVSKLQAFVVLPTVFFWHIAVKIVVLEVDFKVEHWNL